MNIAEILKLKFPEIDLFNQVVLRDDGQGTYIFKWDESLGSKPDAATLTQWEIELEPIKLKLDARQARRESYPAIGDQLDMLYKAMDAGVLPKVNDFYNSIKAVKEQFPVNV